MERTLIILKPSAVGRAIMGEIISRFERKGLIIAGMKMMQLTDAQLDEHYRHLKEQPFFSDLKASMKALPVVVMCVRGPEAIRVVRTLIGATNSRIAAPGTIRGDYSMSGQLNIVHASDSPETAEAELKRFFAEGEIFDYQPKTKELLYGSDEM